MDKKSQDQIPALEIGRLLASCRVISLQVKAMSPLSVIASRLDNVTNIACG